MLVNIRFQVLFHSPPGVLFTVPSQYWSTIGHQVVFWLGGWSPLIPYRFLVSVGTRDTDCYLTISSTRLSLSLVGFPTPFDYSSVYVMSVLTPRSFLNVVWPLPISLATTFGISFDFFSSPYLDVSVREVPFLNLCIQLRIYGSSPYGFPHSEICGSKLISNSPQLIAGNRVLLRLSVPRHSPYALFRLNSRFALLLSFSLLKEASKQFSFYCLSFANNCLGCKFKRPFGFLIH